MSTNIVAWLSPSTNFSQGYQCGNQVTPVQGVETLVRCGGYASGFTASYVTIVRMVPNSKLVIQELRVWRAGAWGCFSASPLCGNCVC